LKITHIAIKLKGKVYKEPIGSSHNEIEKKHKIKEGNRGFLTDKGEWVNRQEAGKIALKSGQVKSMDTPPYLHSGDLK